MKLGGGWEDFLPNSLPGRFGWIRLDSGGFVLKLLYCSFSVERRSFEVRKRSKFRLYCSFSVERRSFEVRNKGKVSALLFVFS